MASIDEIKISKRKITMNLIQTICPNRIAFCTENQRARSAKVGALAPVFQDNIDYFDFTLYFFRHFGNKCRIKILHICF